jgi:hypothetical protein
MEIVKTWLAVLGTLALGFVSLALVQTRGTLALREAEIARLRASAPPAVAPVQAPPAPSSSPAGDSNAAVQALVAMTSERDQYKDGLERCVAEVNRVAHESGRRFEVPVPSQPAAAPAAPSTRAEAHISSLYSEPTVTPLGDQMMVSGKLYNTGKVPGTVTAVVALLRDGKPVNSNRLRVTVPAQGQIAWSTQFPWGSQQGSWTATVSVE